jgi:nicotinamidase-related amidase
VALPLIVIDMQPIWLAASQIIEPCLNEIKLANETNSPVYFIEYHFKPDWVTGERRNNDSRFRTYDLLWNQASLKYHIIKNKMSGGPELIKTLIKDYGYLPTIKVVGVNTEQCVYSTVFEINEKTQNHILIPAHACASDGNHDIGLNLLKHLNKVIIV